MSLNYKLSSARQVMKKEILSDAYQKFIILAMPRTGSNYLSYFLHDHPNIMSIGEVFDIETIWGRPGKPEIDHSRHLKLFRNFFPIAFLNKLIFGKYPKTIKAVGFRLFYHQAEYYNKLLPYILSQNDWKIIHLKRINLLENFVSLHIAEKTGVWSSLKAPSSQLIRISLGFQECLNYFESTTAAVQKFDKLFANFSKIDVYYERLSKSSHYELEKTLSFLGVRKRNLVCSLKKQNTRTLEEVIINYKELKKQFANTFWKSFFT